MPSLDTVVSVFFDTVLPSRVTVSVLVAVLEPSGSVTFVSEDDFHSHPASETTSVVYATSSRAAAPIPPPMHIVTTP